MEALADTGGQQLVVNFGPRTLTEVSLACLAGLSRASAELHLILSYQSHLIPCTAAISLHVHNPPLCICMSRGYSHVRLGYNHLALLDPALPTLESLIPIFISKRNKAAAEFPKRRCTLLSSVDLEESLRVTSVRAHV